MGRGGAGRAMCIYANYFGHFVEHAFRAIWIDCYAYYLLPEVRFVTAATAGGSVKFLPAV